MKKLFLVIIALCAVTSLSFAQGTMRTAETVTLQGVVIDNSCVSSQKPENLAGFVKTHTKECALKPASVASGYSIFSDGKLYKFNEASNTMVEQFLKKEENTLQVEVTASKAGEELILVSIKNQK